MVTNDSLGGAEDLWSIEDEKHLCASIDLAEENLNFSIGADSQPGPNMASLSPLVQDDAFAFNSDRYYMSCTETLPWLML